MSDTTEATILLAEEHDVTRVFLQDNLSADGYRVLVAPDRAKALALLSTAHPDLLVVDVNGQTLELLDAVRSGEGVAGRADPDTPMIVLSRDADRLQRIRLLERGGDDVVKKPFAYPELRARIGAVLRRSQTTGRGRRIVRAGPVVIDVRSQIPEYAGGPRVPGALAYTLAQLPQAAAGLPRDREIVLYCSCPNEASAVRGARLLAEQGVNRTRALKGGLDAWVELEATAPLDGPPIADAGLNPEGAR